MDRSTPSISPLGASAAVIVDRVRLLAALLAAAALFAFLPPAAAAKEARGIVDIGQNAGAITDHFDFVPTEAEQPPWALVEDATATGGVALAHRGTPIAANRSLAVYKPASVENAEISVRIKATGGKEDQGGGIALRLTTPDNYYLVQLDARRDRATFSRVKNGVAEEIVGVDADVTTKEWHRLAVRALEDEFVVSFDGVWVFTAFDKTFAQAGRIAVWTGTDSITRFDSLTIGPPSSSDAQ